MLLSLTGASGVGKSTVLSRLQRIDWGVPVDSVEFDSIGVPAGADTAWRHHAVERWVQYAIRRQDEGVDVLLCGQVPYGELLAAPSASLLDGVAACVLHCSPEERAARLRARGEPEEGLIHHLRFGEWFLAHSLDPRAEPEVIRIDSGAPMEWARWDTWSKGDPRWAPRIIDTDEMAPSAVAAEVLAWAREELVHRSSRRSSGG
jgi:hypothetical protein